MIAIIKKETELRTIAEKSVLGKRWIINNEQTLNSNEQIIDSILSNRGITEPAQIQKFLHPRIFDEMPDPSVMRDMDAGARIIADAIVAEKKIAIFGDYDVDGITATAIMIKYLRGIGCAPLWHLPTRSGEGYGLNNTAIDELRVMGADVIITVDCGISGIKEAVHARALGMQIVITDHHNPEDELPAADAVINPKRVDDNSGLRYLAGVGVAFMFLVALNRELKSRGFFGDDNTSNLMEMLDLVAMGTVCDMMPLIGLNRAFVARGLEIINAKKNIGITALMHIAGAKRASTYAIGFVLGPRLNAAGRIADARPGLELLLTDNAGTAGVLAQKLNELNHERIDVQNSIMLRATEIAEQCAVAGDQCLFIVGENWHKGVMGIIAGRLKDKFNMPALVGTMSDGVIDGSGRSVAAVNLGQIIHDAVAAGILSEGGGHAAAAGFGLRAESADAFREFLRRAVSEQLANAPAQNDIIVDAEIDAGAANMRLIDAFAALAPFGQENEEPIIVLTGAELSYATVMGNGQHLRGNLRTSAGNLAFVGFNMVHGAAGDFLLDDANVGRKIMALGRLQPNEYNGRTTPQLILEDVAI